MSRPIKPKPITDPKQLSSQPEIAPHRFIEHVNVLPDGYDSDQFIRCVEELVSVARSVAGKYEENERVIARADLETQDLLHEIHLLPAANAPKGYRYYGKLREAQLSRRQAKHENVLMAPLYKFVSQKPEVISSLAQLMNALKDAHTKVDNYRYTYRIQDEE